jgi:hypothetical protein
MSLFVSTPPSVRGVFAVENPPPSIVVPQGTNVAVAVGQFPWGPSNSLQYPGSMGAFYNAFAPRGMTRTGSAHLSVIRKAWPVLGAVRAKDPTAVVATAVISSSTPTQILRVTLNSAGTQGNSVIVTVGAADDGNANHFDLTVSVTGASGTTSEIFRNVNISGTGADVIPSTTGSVLVGSLTKLASGIPVPGNTTCSGGTEGTTTATHYVGTPGGGDYGFALLESDSTINHVFTDDCGNSLRAAVNAGLEAHVELTTDRVGYINGNSGQSVSSAQTDVANYRSIRIVYVDPWAYIYDDTTGALQLAPSSCWGASVAAQLPPSAAISWRNDTVSGFLDGIAQLEFDRGSNRGQNTAAGIATLTKRKKGGFTFEADVVTSLTPGETELTRTRMGQFIASSVVQSWEEYTDAPMVTRYQQDMINGAEAFLSGLKQNQNLNPLFYPYIDDYQVLDPSSANTATSEDNGDYTVPINVKIGSNMHRIFLSLQYGESVTIQPG